MQRIGHEIQAPPFILLLGGWLNDTGPTDLFSGLFMPQFQRFLLVQSLLLVQPLDTLTVDLPAFTQQECVNPQIPETGAVGLQFTDSAAQEVLRIFAMLVPDSFWPSKARGGTGLYYFSMCCILTSTSPASRTFHLDQFYGRPSETINATLYSKRRRLSQDHDFLEIAFVVQVKGMHLSLHGLEPVKSGDVFVLRPGAWHAYFDCENLEVINCNFGIELLEEELSILMQNTAVGYLFRTGPLSLDRRGILSFHLSPQLLAECLGYLEAMLGTINENKLSGRIAWMGNLLLMLSRLIDSLEDENRLPAEQIAPLHDAVLNAIHLLEESPAHDWTLREITERVHLNPSHLVRLFKLGTGLPPLAYLARLRAEKAASLLLRTDSSIGHERRDGAISATSP